MSKDTECGIDDSDTLSTRKKIKSLLWRLTNKTLFRMFPNNVKAPRILLLKLFGAKISTSAHISRTANIRHPWNLEMGSSSSLGDHSRACCMERVTIGNNCRIGSDVNLLTGINYVDSLSFSKNLKPIHIQDGCWISSGSCVLQGVRLGDYTMVGEASIVTENTDAFSIVGGKPAQVIKKAMLKSE